MQSLRQHESTTREEAAAEAKRISAVAQRGSFSFHVSNQKHLAARRGLGVSAIKLDTCEMEQLSPGDQKKSPIVNS